MTCENVKATGETVERRFSELKRVLRLNDLELEILMVAYIRTQTCFAWPVRIDTREKPVYYAMTLDRSYGEITKAMSANGKLRKLNLLDSDWDFNSRVIGGYLDGTDAEALGRRFYKKDGDTETLPWEFFGELAEMGGGTLCYWLYQLCTE